MTRILRHQCPKCKATMSGITSRQMTERAKLMMRLCPNCGKVTEELLPTRGHKPNDSLRGRLRAEAHKMSRQFLSGELAYRNGYWYPVSRSAKAAAPDEIDQALSGLAASSRLRRDLVSSDPVLDGEVAPQPMPEPKISFDFED